MPATRFIKSRFKISSDIQKSKELSEQIPHDQLIVGEPNVGVGMGHEHDFLEFRGG